MRIRLTILFIVLTLGFLPEGIFARRMVLPSATLKVLPMKIPVSSTYFYGETNVPIVGVSLEAGTAGDVIVDSIRFHILADDDGSFDSGGYGDSDPWNVASHMSLVDTSNNTVLGRAPLVPLSQAVGSTSHSTVTFNLLGLNFRALAARSKVIELRADLQNSGTSPLYVSADIIPGADIEAISATTMNRVIATDGSGGLLNAVTGTLIIGAAFIGGPTAVQPSIFQTITTASSTSSPPTVAPLPRPTPPASAQLLPCDHYSNSLSVAVDRWWIRGGGQNATIKYKVVRALPNGFHVTVHSQNGVNQTPLRNLFSLRQPLNSVTAGSIAWDGTDDAGRVVPRGMYYVYFKDGFTGLVSCRVNVL